MDSSMSLKTLTDDQDAFKKMYKDLTWIHREDCNEVATNTSSPQMKDAETTTELVEVNCFTCGMHFYDYPYQHNFKDLMVAETKIFKANLLLMKTLLPQVSLVKLNKKTIEQACQGAVQKTHTLPVQIPIRKRSHNTYTVLPCKIPTTNFSPPPQNPNLDHVIRQEVVQNQKSYCPGSVLTSSNGKEDGKDKKKINIQDNNNIIVLD